MQQSPTSSIVEPCIGSDLEVPDRLLQNKGAESTAVERPRSALHSGDFTTERNKNGGSNLTLSTSPPAPWTSLFPSAIQTSHAEIDHKSPYLPLKRPYGCIRARAVSQIAFPESFSLRPPTSPLVYQANSTDAEMSTFPQLKQMSRSPDQANRRHTFSPRSFQTYHSLSSNTPSFTPNSRRGLGIPYQAHQPRRSVSSMTTFSSPKTPINRSRRPSYASDTSPLHHAPMVGSFEESILRGRMSTNPSQPLDFVAQIGVLGKGSCPSNLRCPPHVTIPFPAVFYTYGSGNGRIPGNLPSPYVGLVDIQNSLTSAEAPLGIKQNRGSAVSKDNHDNVCYAKRTELESTRVESRKREKIRRRLTCPKVPPGGSYRIPQQGQIQIVIKNPNKTAVKLFLVPYDLSDMEPGHKTFIRQRSYSAGPVIDMPLSSRENLGTDRPEASLSTSDEPTERPVLRYLIHLHICCPAIGRFYLYKSIRVVFANRVLDGKEKLRNEIQLPEPRYSLYKPSREHQQHTMSTNEPISSIPLRQAADTYNNGNLYSPLPHCSEHDMVPERSDCSLFQLSTRHPFGLSGCALGSMPLDQSVLPTLASRPAGCEYMEIDSSSSLQSKDLSPKISSARETYRAASLYYPHLSSWEDFSCNESQAFDELNNGNTECDGISTEVNLSDTLYGPGLLTSQFRGLDFHREYRKNNGPG